jgi:putative photosynthetic complex assembly protein 2
VFLWWFLTGVILLLVRRADRQGPSAHRALALYSSPVFVFSGLACFITAGHSSLIGIYASFFSALLFWGWVELAFLTGLITGPNKDECPKGVSETERFLKAWSAISYCELLLFSLLLTYIYIGWNAENKVGMWTFVILFFARVSAKLNLFLGVPNVNTEFLALPLKHLVGYFRIRPINWLFPISVSIITFVLFCLIERIFREQAGSDVLVGFVLLASLTALALIEHWFMVLSVPDAELWRWMMPKKPAQKGGTQIKPLKFVSEKINEL